MDLQNIFYIVGIIAMVMFMVLIAVVVYMMFFIKRVVVDTQRRVVGKIKEYTKLVDVFKGLATSVMGNILLKIKNNFGLR